MVMGVVQGVFVLRMIGPEGAGLLGVITTFTNAADQLAQFRIYEMLVRYVRQYEEEGNPRKAAAVYKVAGLFEMTGALVAFALIWFLSPWGAEFFGKDPATRPLWVLYGVVVLINFIFDSSQGLVQVFNRFRVQAAANIVQSLVTLVLAASWYFNGGGLFEVILIYIIGKAVWAGIITASAVTIATREWGRGWWRTPISVLKDDRSQLVRFAFSTNFSNTISLITKGSESLWVAAFLGTEVAGYYKFALNVVGVLKLPVTPLAQTTYPELSREVVKKNWESVQDTLRRGSRLAAVYTLPLIAFLGFFGQWVIALVYGAEWLPGYPLLMILMVGQAWDNIFYWNRVGLLALNRPVYPTVVNFIGMVIKVGLIFVLVEQYQAVAFAGLLSFYYIFTAGIAAGRVALDVRQQMQLETGP
jgi:O-antigen/teichoic acid export membrane protein